MSSPPSSACNKILITYLIYIKFHVGGAGVVLRCSQYLARLYSDERQDDWRKMNCKGCRREKPGWLSWYNDGLRAARPGFDSWQGQEISLNRTASRLALGITQPLIQWVPGALLLGVKRQDREADHSPPSSSEEWWSCTSTPPYAFMAWCLIA
jgi:hypothetical protein